MYNLLKKECQVCLARLFFHDVVQLTLIMLLVFNSREICRPYHPSCDFAQHPCQVAQVCHFSSVCSLELVVYSTLSSVDCH